MRTALAVIVLAIGAFAQRPAFAQVPAATTPAPAPAATPSAATAPPDATTTAAAASQDAKKLLTLEDALRLALDQNPDLQKQRLLALSSGQDRILARAAILPRLDFNASAGRTRSESPAGKHNVQGVVQDTPEQLDASNNFSTGLQFKQLVFDGGKWWNNLDAADLNLKSSQAQVDEQQLQIGFLVEQRFYELVRAQRQLRVLGDAAARSRDQAGFVQKLFDGGRATQADVYQARVNRDNDEIQRLGQETRVELARADLALAVGTDPGEPLAVAEPPRLMDDPAQPPPPNEAVQRALANRPSIKAAELATEANRKQARAAHGDYWPTVSVAATYNRGTRELGQFTDLNPGNSSQLTGIVNLNWNLFSGLTTDANVRKAEVQIALSENDLQNGRRNVAADVEKAVAQLSSARAQVRVSSQTLVTAQEGLRLARTRQQVGVGTQLEVRDAELKLTQSELTHVGALVDGREAEAALRRAQGG